VTSARAVLNILSDCEGPVRPIGLSGFKKIGSYEGRSVGITVGTKKIDGDFLAYPFY